MTIFYPPSASGSSDPGISLHRTNWDTASNTNGNAAKEIPDIFIFANTQIKIPE